MKSSLKIVWKTKITFLLSEALLFFFEQKYILFSETSAKVGISPGDIKIPGWCPAGPVLPHGEKMPL